MLCPPSLLVLLMIFNPYNQRIIIDPNAGAISDWEKYHNLETIDKFLYYLENKYDSVQIEILPEVTADQNQMKVVKVCKGVCGTKKAVWIDGGIHAREWISPAAVLWMLNELLENEEYRHLIENLDWYILPVHNPDGYVYSYTRKDTTTTEGRFWRASRNNSGTCVTDLNRNFGYKWVMGPTEERYCKEGIGSHGTEAWSEAETRNVRDFILSRKGDWVTYDSVHAFSKLILLPWQYSKTEKPENYQELLEIAQRGAQAMRSQYGHNYLAVHGGAHLYTAHGTGFDWAYSIGVEFSTSLELRPGSKNYNEDPPNESFPNESADTIFGFALDPQQIPETGRELLAFHESVANHYIDKYYGITDSRVCSQNIQLKNDPLGAQQGLHSHYFPKTKKCYYYYHSEIGLTWVTARATCKSFGGELASVLDEETGGFLMQTFFPERQLRSIWIGGYRNTDNDNWAWTDSSSFEYTNWHEQSNSNGDYLAFDVDQNGKWESRKQTDLNEISNFICQLSHTEGNNNDGQESLEDLSIQSYSSVYAGDMSKFGPENALTKVSSQYYGYWHSARGDTSPRIILSLLEESDISYIEVTDRLDCCPERFSNVEVRTFVSVDEIYLDGNKDGISCGKKSYNGQEHRTYRFDCPTGTRGKIIVIQKDTEYLHVNNVKVFGKKNENEERVEIGVIGHSSVWDDDNEKWGPENALTEVSKNYYGYWHSNRGDHAPQIDFGWSEEREVVFVEVTDRFDCCEDRFSDVEVLIRDSNQQETSCGKKSYHGQESRTYRYYCPNETRGKHLVVKKNGEILHVNHVEVVVRKETENLIE